jgi:hypothetical protein
MSSNTIYASAVQTASCFLSFCSLVRIQRVFNKHGASTGLLNTVCLDV